MRDETTANFFAGARGGQNQRQSFEISLLGDETIATFRVRAPAERHERKVLSDVRQAWVKRYLESFLEPGGVPRDTLESVQGTPEATACTFHRFLRVPGSLFEAIWRHIGVPMATCGDAWAHRWAPRDTKKRVRDRTRLLTRSTERLWTIPGWLYVMKTY